MSAQAARRTRASEAGVLSYARAHRAQAAQALGLGTITALFSVLLMFAAGYLIAKSALRPDSIFIAFVPVIGVQVFGLGKPVARYLERLASHDWVLRLTSDLQVRLYRTFERATSAALPRNTGRALAYLDDDIAHLQNLYLRCLFPLACAWACALVVSVAAGAFSLAFAACLFALFAFCGLGAPFAALVWCRGPVVRAKELTAKTYESLTDNALGIADWRFAGRGGEFAQASAEAHAPLARAQASARARERAVALATRIALGAGAVACLVWAQSCFGGPTSEKSHFIAAFALGFFPLIELFAPLPDAAAGANAHRVSLARLTNLETIGNAPGRAPDAPRAAERNASRQAGQRLSAGYPQNAVLSDSGGTGSPSSGETALASSSVPLETRRTPVLDAAITIADVTFSHPGAKTPVLEHLSLEIPTGQHLAVLGKSGAGKTTLAALIHGDIAPCAGSVTVGGSTPRARSAHMHETVCFIEQNPYLFDKTVRDNLLIARPDAADEELHQALDAVGLAPLVESLPLGLDTMAHEAGARFSGGERQRIAFARALLSHAPIIVLDEPMVGLDPETEHGIMQTLFSLAEGKTIVMITHHLLDIERFDRVVFIENGGCALDGAPERLAHSSERYARLLALDRANRSALERAGASRRAAHWEVRLPRAPSAR